MIKPKIGKCIDCSSDSPEKRLIAKRCEFHYWQHRKKVKGSTISKVSPKRKKENREYTIKRLQFLSQPGNQRCFIEGCNNRADTVEHTAGRWGKNYLDTSTWKPCCNFHNLELERNSELSEKYQISKISGKQKIIKK
ncbi:hypothetical protein V2E39_22725 [Chryseobacterium arthrosphaerae]|uniref:HNH endonuclease n=1 Tax=Chryseobacterium arthrosphaerae TaxID=651561 RepID=A0ABU7R612_9FLAO